MKISFVIPAYNEEARIGSCIEAIQKEIASTTDPATGAPSDAEILVVNNASTDRTKEIALTYPGVHVVDESRKGVVWARQAGYEASRGDLVANIDADVELTRGWLLTVLKAFEEDEKIVVLSGPFIYHDISAVARLLVKLFYMAGYVLYLINRFVLRVGSMVQGGNYVVRRTALVKAGGYDTSITFYGEDTDVGRRLLQFGKVVWTFALPVYTSGRRFKGEGIVKTSAIYTLNYFWVTFFGKPFTYKYKDFRPPVSKQ